MSTLLHSTILILLSTIAGLIIGYLNDFSRFETQLLIWLIAIALNVQRIAQGNEK